MTRSAYVAQTFDRSDTGAQVTGQRETTVGALRDAVAMLMGADRRRRGRVTREAALSHTHLRAMWLLVREGEATAGALARAADLNPASVTAMVDQLQRRGLVERRRHTADRRVCLIALTRPGAALVAAEQQRATERLHRLLEGFADEELQAATKVLDRLRTLIDDADAVADCGGGDW